MIDREEVERRMRATFKGLPRGAYIEAWAFDKAVSVALDLLREFGHVAGCACLEDGCYAFEAMTHTEHVHTGPHKHRDPRCFQQSPAKETR